MRLSHIYVLLALLLGEPGWAWADPNADLLQAIATPKVNLEAAPKALAQGADVNIKNKINGATPCKNHL